MPGADYSDCFTGFKTADCTKANLVSYPACYGRLANLAIHRGKLLKRFKDYECSDDGSCCAKECEKEIGCKSFVYCKTLKICTLRDKEISWNTAHQAAEEQGLSAEHGDCFTGFKTTNCRKGISLSNNI